jgi:hypothetical protein
LGVGFGADEEPELEKPPMNADGMGGILVGDRLEPEQEGSLDTAAGRKSEH